MPEVFETQFTNYRDSVGKLFNALKIGKELKKQERIVIKPNLTISLPPPCTTSAQCSRAIIEYCRKNSDAEIIVAEGSGGCSTKKAFKEQGYLELAKETGIKLVNLNKAERVELKDERALRLKTFRKPKILEGCYLINAPVLKEHNEAVITASMKNLVGTYMESRIFALSGWNKGKLHLLGLQECIFDLNIYTKIDLSIVDASTGQKGHEITGKACEPAIGKILCSKDRVAIDSYGAKLLGHDWRDIKHIKYANGVLGTCDLEKVKIIKA